MRKTQGKGSRSTVDPELAGDVPKLATVQDRMGSNPPPSGRDGPARASAKGKNGKDGTPKINLKAVAEALMDEGLDPAVEIARVLKGRPVLDANGKAVKDPVTGEPLVEHLVEPDVRLRTLNSLLEFTQPKLKAVEVKMSGTLELTNEQLDQRLSMLLEKVQGA